MSAWSGFMKGVEDGFNRRPCRVHGERYPGCPLDQIELARPLPPSGEGFFTGLFGADAARRDAPPRDSAWEDYARPAPFPAPQVDPYAQAIIADLRAENQQCRQLIAEYEEVTAAYAARPEVPAAWQQAVEDGFAQRDGIIREQADQLAQVTETKDRFKASGKRIAAEKREIEARARDLETALAYPGALKAARKAARVATHPDHGGSTQQFQAAEAVFDRIEKKGRG
jgi:hypothetical protein